VAIGDGDGDGDGISVAAGVGLGSVAVQLATTIVAMSVMAAVRSFEVMTIC
jgi:UDP-N-acetylmuramyl pentapeptide phosphotransferase/UDP-N-acetylglucosamine-1-phosphate transferase